ncbi:MAG: PKD domain-containing protein [Planctomycetes bacterium]|nr:PKD domain-containing protein [Planctomycetota bacterium]
MIEDPPGDWPEGDDDDPILPPADLVYDGPKEYDDLASSFYHTRWVPGNPLNPEEPVAVLLDHGGDQAFGEVTTTSPDVADRMNYGHDKADLGGNGTSFVPDGFITPAGPLAGADTAFFGPGGALILDFNNGAPDVIHGGPGFDGGNILVLEYMTRRTDGTAPTEPLGGPPTLDPDGNGGRGFRDFNLDGMIDLGEGRQFAHSLSDGTDVGGTENYVIDSFVFTAPNDGMAIMAYPFNRDRLIEDVIEAVDPVEDFDTWVNGPIGCLGAGTADISHMTFLPEGLPSTRPFAVTSPSQTMPIITVDRMPPAAEQQARLQDMIDPPPYTFPNLAASLDRNGETNQGLEPDSTFGVAFAAHEFGHYWECWPDLYDYDVFDGFENEHPIAAWDLMSGSAAGLVHIIPVFKESSGWIQSIDLTTVLIPGVPRELRLGPIEASCDQYFYYENLLRANPGREERFYFFHLEDHGEFSSILPWNVAPMEACDDGGGSTISGGMMILHTDLAANSEGVPAQQRIGSHFTYLYEQADGQHSLEVTINAGGNTGDAGDPFPGFCDATEWNIDTDPDNSWWDSPNDDSGIEIIDIRNELSGSQATFLWFPRDIPTLQFVQPPGGRSIDGNFPLIVRWSDQHAGTGLTIFAQRSENLGVNELGICSGDCFGGAKVNTTPLTKPAPGTAFDTIQVPLGPRPTGPEPMEQDGLYRFYAFLAPRHVCPANDGGCENLFSPPVAAATNEGEGMLSVNNVVLDVNNPDSTRLEAWIVTFVGSDECDGNGEWQVEGTVSGVQLADSSNPASPLACASTGGQFTTQNPDGAVTFTITAMGEEFVPGDRFIFVTTGFTPYSASVEVEEGEIDPGPKAIIMADSTQSPCCFPPVTITFDGSESTDSDGNSGSGGNLFLYEWDLHNDGTVDRTGPIASFTFSETGLFEVRLTVSEGEPNFRTGTAVRTVEITNNRPIASFTATPNVGPSDLLVHFDAGDSFDSDGAVVKYEWDFDYTGENCCDCPFSPDAAESDPQIDRIFPEGSFSVALRVTDDVGDESCVTTLSIHSGNQPPAASFTATPEGGQVPLTVVFDASASSDPDGDDLSYQWNFEDDSSTVGPSDDPVVVHTFTEVNETGWRVTLTVDDGSEGDAGTDTEPKEIIVTLGAGNTVTITQANATPSIGPSPLTVAFSATATSQNPGTLTYRWELDGQGTLKFGRNVTHTYFNNGAERIEVHPKLIVTDDTGAQAVRVLDVTVLLEGDAGPVDDPNLEAVLTLVDAPESDSAIGIAPFLVRFSTAGSRALDGTAVTVEVDFGDGTPPAPVLAGAELSHTYQRPDEYEATATTVAEDDRREISAPITIIVTESASPIAMIFVDQINGDAPLAIRFDGTGSFDPEGQPLTHEWEFGDGTPVGTGSVLRHTFNVPDQYTVTLTVRDASGATGTALLQITVGEGILTNDPTGIGSVDGGGDIGDGQAEPGMCGLGCGPMGAAQLLLMLLGMMSMKYTLRRRR